VAVIMDLKENTQRFFKAHQKEVAVISVSRDGQVVATAEIDKQPKIRLWKFSNMEEI
jgi:hypothetical protein